MRAGDNKLTLPRRKSMREPPVINLNLRPPLLMLRPLPLRMPPHPRNKLVPLPTRNPMVRLCKQKEELGHKEPGRLVGVEDFPELLVPLVGCDGLHLVCAHVKRLPHCIRALQERGGDGGGAGAEA